MVPRVDEVSWNTPWYVVIEAGFQQDDLTLEVGWGHDCGCSRRRLAAYGYNTYAVGTRTFSGFQGASSGITRHGSSGGGGGLHVN